MSTINLNTPATYANLQGLNAKNLVYMAGMNGNNLVASGQALDLDTSGNDVFLQNRAGDVGINQAAMLKQFQAQYRPQGTGNRVTDEARQDYAFCQYATQQFEAKSGEVFNLLDQLPPDQKAQSRELLKQVDEQARAEAARKGMSPEQTKEYVNLMSFRALADNNKGTALGARSKEAYALGNYERDAFNFTNQKYGMPTPGSANPYNQQGQSSYTNALNTNDQQIMQQMQMMRIMQFLQLMSLMQGGGMGFMPMMLSGWFR